VLNDGRKENQKREFKVINGGKNEAFVIARKDELVVVLTIDEIATLRSQ